MYRGQPQANFFDLPHTDFGNGPDRRTGRYLGRIAHTTIVSLVAARFFAFRGPNYVVRGANYNGAATRAVHVGFVCPIAALEHLVRVAATGIAHSGKWDGKIP